VRDNRQSKGRGSGRNV